MEAVKQFQKHGTICPYMTDGLTCNAQQDGDIDWFMMQN